MKLLERLHGSYVASRRVRVLSRHLAELLPARMRVLDVGCGDGLLPWLLMRDRPDLSIQGIDVLVRPGTCIPVEPFDGSNLPYPAGAFDAVLFADVLHHTEDPLALLREAARVASRWIVIKDHLLEGALAGPTLRFMDRVGNARHGVRLPFNYWPQPQWREAFAALGLDVDVWTSRLGLYPWPASLLFDRSLHFLARLRIVAERNSSP